MENTVIAASPIDIPVRGWISVNDELPSEETPVLIFWNGNIIVGERRWEHPTFEETFNAFWYWDDPTDDGQDWERNEVTHWMPLPEAPNAKVTGPSLRSGPVD